MELHPHPRRPGLFVNVGIYVGHPPAELPARQIGQRHRRLLAQLHERQVLLVNLRLDPDQPQVGQPVGPHPRFHHLPLYHRLLDHKAVLRSDHRHRLARLARALKVRDLFVRDVQELQLRPRCGLQRRGIGRVGPRLDSQQILALRAVKLG